jgi:hypothetical protein
MKSSSEGDGSGTGREEKRDKERTGLRQKSATQVGGVGSVA